MTYLKVYMISIFVFNVLVISSTGCLFSNPTTHVSSITVVLNPQYNELNLTHFNLTQDQINNMSISLSISFSPSLSNSSSILVDFQYNESLKTFVVNNGSQVYVKLPIYQKPVGSTYTLSFDFLIDHPTEQVKLFGDDNKIIIILKTDKDSVIYDFNYFNDNIQLDTSSDSGPDILKIDGLQFWITYEVIYWD